MKQRKRPERIVLGMMVFGLLLGLWGINKNLPYIPEADEPIYVTRAVSMASTGDMNPKWFGNPGSTTIYPLVLGFHLWHSVTQNGTLLATNPNLIIHFNQNISAYYLIGRLLSVMYAVLSIPLTYAVGKRMFTRRIALIGTGLLLTYSIFWSHAQLVRTDLAATFWGLLSLWLLFRVLDQPSWQRYVMAGLVIGISVASRYFMVTLVSVLFIIWLIQYWNLRQDPKRWQMVRNGFLGFVAIAVGFTVITPYFFLDWNTAVSNILLEARSDHLGADGLSKWGNFWWYMTVAFPQSISWPQFILALAGIGLALTKRKQERLLIVMYIFVFLIAASISPLHWIRWILQLLPLIALMTASAMDELVNYSTQHLNWNTKTQSITLFIIVVIVSIVPANNLSRFKLKQTHPSTRLMARQWIIENIPSGSKIALERYTAPLIGTDYEFVETYSLIVGNSVEAYAAKEYGYLIAGAANYNRYYAEPERYAKEVAFYDILFRETELIQEFSPSALRGGTTILIFKLP